MPTVRVRRVHLELSDRAQFRPPARDAAPAGARAAPIAPCPTDVYRALYAVVGGPWHWRDRLAWSDDQLRAHLDDPRVRVWGLRAPGLPAGALAAGFAGYFELVAGGPGGDGAVEIQYFGLVPGAIGRGLGGFLLARAVEEAWALGAGRVTLNTCSLDAPQALPNYRARGFREVRDEWYDQELAADAADAADAAGPPPPTSADARGGEGGGGDERHGA
jgi:GNAT superfamily N-acetyltransferase